MNAAAERPTGLEGDWKTPTDGARAVVRFVAFPGRIAEIISNRVGSQVGLLGRKGGRRSHWIISGKSTLNDAIAKRCKSAPFSPSSGANSKMTR